MGTIGAMSDAERFTVDQYHKMIEAGILMSGDQIRLLEGLLCQK